MPVTALIGLKSSIKPMDFSLGKYDRVFLGTPVWAGKTPPAVYQKKCDNCSLVELCMPKIKKMKNADTYIDNMLTDLEQDIS